MAINNFRVVSYDAQPERSIYNFIEREVEGVKVLLQSNIDTKSNIMPKDACVFVKISDKWISAIYEQKFNPSDTDNYLAFTNNLKIFVSYLLKNY